MPKLDSKDISLIRGLKSQGWSNTRIAEERFNGITRQTLEASIKRYDRNRQRFDTKINMETGTTQLVEIKQTKGLSKIHNDGGHIRLGKYGSVPPTGYISQLDNHTWCMKYFGKYWDWDYPELRDYRNMTDNYTFKLMHRGAGKSVSDVMLYTRDFVENIKFSVITAGRGMLGKIVRGMEFCTKTDLIRRDYGDLLLKTNKSEGYMLRTGDLSTSLDPSAQFRTRLGEIVGTHNDKFYWHDPIQTPFKSHESNEALLDLYDTLWRYTADWFGGCGTRKSLSDFYVNMMPRGFKFFYRPAVKLISGRYPTRDDCKIKIIEDETTGKSTEEYLDIDLTTGVFESTGCPKWPLRALLIERIKNPYGFESQMQNNPLARSGLIRWSDFLPYSIDYDDNNRVRLDGYNLKEFNFVAFFDDATGETKLSDKRALVLMAKHRASGHFYMYDQVIGHTKWIGAHKIKQIESFINEKEGELGIRILLYVETVKNQRDTFQRLRDDSSLYVKEHNPKDRGKKTERILDGIVVDLEHHKIHIRSDLRFKHHLQEEVIGFGGKKHVDALDAWDQAHHLLKKPKGNWRS